MESTTSLTYAERLETFVGCWDEDLTTARQLAAIGHICDRPPLEALEEGSHCISCDAFVCRALSVRALGANRVSAGSYEQDMDNFNFHHPSCTRLQVRIPLDPQAVLPGLHTAYNMNNIRAKWEKRIAADSRPTPTARAAQSSSLFSLPTELRLEIYRMILPSIHDTTQITQLHRDSPRVLNSRTFFQSGPRDTSAQNILQTCRAVHGEALELLYPKTTFQFCGQDGAKVLFLFLRSIGEAGRSLVKSVDVQCGSREDAMAFALLASCAKLRSITIRLPRPRALFPRPPIWVHDGMSALLELSELQNVNFRPAEASATSMSDEHSDAAVIRKELTRPRGTPSSISVVNGFLDL